MDLIFKTKKREISLLFPLFFIFIAIPIFLIAGIILIFEYLMGIVVWVDLFDGKEGFVWWEVLRSNHGMFVSVSGVIINLAFGLFGTLFIIYLLFKGGQFIFSRLELKV